MEGIEVMTNWFTILLVVIQSCAGIQYLFTGKFYVGALFLMYAVCNIILFKMGQ